MIDLIIVSFNNLKLTSQAIESALNNSEPPEKIIVVDNNSSDGTVPFLKQNFPGIHLITLQENTGYGKAVNIAFSHTASPYVLISNNDVIFPVKFFTQLRKLIEQLNGNFGVIGFQQIYPDKSYQNSYGKFHTLLSAIYDVIFISKIVTEIKKVNWRLGLSKLKEVDYVDGAVMCVSREAFQGVSGFDEDFFFYSEEVDLCKRLRNKGHRIYVDLRNFVIHYRGQGLNHRIGLTFNSIPMFVSSRALYCKKHLSVLEAKIYMFLESIYYKELSFLWHIRSFLENKDYSEIVAIIKEISRQFHIQLKKFSTERN
ncbi:MAG: glycosyltransferase family 2 protein [Candidatus Kapaibacteriota bacterium]